MASNPFTAYTKITDCALSTNHDTCSDCIFINDLSPCNDTEDVHGRYDIFVSCNNYGSNIKSNKYDCTNSDIMEYGKYKSCNMDEQKLEDKKLIIVVLAVAIFGSIFCVILFAVYSKYQDTKRLKRNTNLSHTNKKNHDYVSTPTEVQMQPVINNKDKYVPPPQPMFIYQTRQIAMDQNEEDDDNDGHYDMEQIIPNILFAKKISASESYGLIRNQDDDEEDEDIDDQQKHEKDINE